MTTASPSAAALSRWHPHAAATVEAPTVDEVLAGLARPAWMAAEVATRLAVGTPWEVAAAWGMAARLGEPAARPPPAALLDAAPPEAPAVAWLARNPEAAPDLAARAIHEADRLVDALPELAAALVEGHAGALDEALAWLHRRDDLESVALVLARAGVAVDAVRLAAAAVDREAGLRQEMWAFAGEADDARLSAVSWQEPAAWWGRALRAAPGEGEGARKIPGGPSV